MKRNGDSTHPCRSPTTTISSCGLTWPTRAQTSEQEYNDLKVNKRGPSSPYYRCTPQSFSRGTWSYAFLRSAKHVEASLAYSQDLTKFAGEWNLVCSAMARKTALGIIQFWFNYFEPSFSMHLAYTFAGRLRREMLRELVILSWFPSTHTRSDHFFGFLQTKCRTVWFEKGIKKKYFTWIVCMGMIIPVCQSFGALPEHQATWRTWVSQTTPLFEALSISDRTSY